MAGKLEDRVKDIIVEQLGVNAEQVTSEASFIDDLGGMLDGNIRRSLERGCAHAAQ